MADDIGELIDSAANSAEGQDGMLEEIINSAAESTGPMDKLLQAINNSKLSLRVIDVFNSLDEDKSKTLNREELEGGLRRLGLRQEKHVTPEEIRLKAGGRGGMSSGVTYEKEDEVEVHLKEEGVWVAGKVDKTHPDETYDVALDVLSESELTELLEAFDVDDHGEISMEEWVGGMKKELRRMTHAKKGSVLNVESSTKPLTKDAPKENGGQKQKEIEQELKAAKKKMARLEKAAKAAEEARKMADAKSKAAEEAKHEMEEHVKKAEERRKTAEKEVEEERRDRAADHAKAQAEALKAKKESTETARIKLAAQKRTEQKMREEEEKYEDEDKTREGKKAGKEKKAEGAKSSILAAATKGRVGQAAKKIAPAKEHERPANVSDELWEWQKQRLQAFPFFKGFSSGAVEALATRLVQVEAGELNAGEFILRRGQVAEKMYFIKEGELEVMDKQEKYSVATLTKHVEVAGDNASDSDENEDGGGNGVANCGEGSGYFGEMALIPDARRTAAVRVKKATKPEVEVELYSLEQAHVHEVLQAEGYDDETDLVHAVIERDKWLVGTLLQAEVFKNCSVDFLHRFAAVVEERPFKPGSMVFRQGDAALQMYLVYEGSVEVVDSFDGGSVKEILGPGKLFGETAALTGMKRTAGVRATDLDSGAVCLVIGIKLLESLLATNPEYRRPIARLALRRLEKNEEGLISTRTWRDRRSQERSTLQRKRDSAFDRSMKHLREHRDGSGKKMHDHDSHMKFSEETSEKFKQEAMNEHLKSESLKSPAFAKRRTARENALFARRQLTRQLEIGDIRGTAYTNSLQTPVVGSEAGSGDGKVPLRKHNSVPAAKGRRAQLHKHPSKMEMLFNSPMLKKRSMGGLRGDKHMLASQKSSLDGTLNSSPEDIWKTKVEKAGTKGENGKDVRIATPGPEEHHDSRSDRVARRKSFFDQMSRPRADPAGKRFDRCGRKVVPPSSMVPVSMLQQWIEGCGCERAVAASTRLRIEWEEYEAAKMKTSKSGESTQHMIARSPIELFLLRCELNPTDKEVSMTRALPYLKSRCLLGKYDAATSRAWDEAVVRGICAKISDVPRLERELRELRAMGGRELDEKKGGKQLLEKMNAAEKALKQMKAAAGATAAADMVRRLDAWLRSLWRRKDAHPAEDNSRSFARGDEAHNCKFAFERSPAAARAMSSTECGYDFSTLDDGTDVVGRNEAWVKKLRYELKEAREDHARVLDRAASARDCNDPMSSSFLKRCEADQKARLVRMAALEASIAEEEDSWIEKHQAEHGHNCPTKQRLHAKFTRESFLDRMNRLIAQRERSQLELTKALLKATQQHRDSRTEHEQRLERDKVQSAQEAEARSLTKRLGLLQEVFDYRPGEAGRWQGEQQSGGDGTGTRQNKLLGTKVLLERLQQANKTIDPGYRLTSSELHGLISECIGTNRSTGGPVARQTFCRHVHNRYGHYGEGKRKPGQGPWQQVGDYYDAPDQSVVEDQYAGIHNLEKELGKGVTPGLEGRQKAKRAREAAIFRDTKKAALAAASRGRQGTSGPNQRQRRMVGTCVVNAGGGLTPHSPARR
jgi:CRP-like cAMP-binding protein